MVEAAPAVMVVAVVAVLVTLTMAMVMTTMVGTPTQSHQRLLSWANRSTLGLTHTLTPVTTIKGANIGRCEAVNVITWGASAVHA